MRFARIEMGGRPALAVLDGEELRVGGDGVQASLDDLIAAGGGALAEAFRACRNGIAVSPGEVTFLPPLIRPPKLVCVGLNYHDHAAETAHASPSFPTIFGRFASSLIGHGAPIIKPALSDQLDFEGELVVVIGKGGRDITRSAALDHVAAYSVFNDGSIRDYQTKTPQWTAGKNFDGTGAFGPYLVTADELPPGAKGLRIETRLNGMTVQSASTANMIFDVVELVALLSSFMTLEPGDVIVSGTPAGVGMARSPQLWMKHGDVCEVEIEGVGLLSNPIRAA